MTIQKTLESLMNKYKDMRNVERQKAEKLKIESDIAYARVQAYQDAIYELKTFIDHQDKEKKRIEDENKTNIKEVELNKTSHKNYYKTNYDSVKRAVKELLTTQVEHTDPFTAWTYNNILIQLNTKFMNLQPSASLNDVLEDLLDNDEIIDVSKQKKDYKLTNGIFQWNIK